MSLVPRRLTVVASALLALVVTAAPALARQSSNQNQNKASTSDNGIGVGVNFGFTSTSIHGTDVVGAYNSRTGGLFGLWVGGNKNGLIGFTGEFNYLKGVGFADTLGNEVKQDYFEIPMLFHVNVGSHSRNGVGGFVLFGPSIDILLKSDLNGLDVKDLYNGFNYGVMAGGGIEAYRIGVQVRGNWGLKNVASDLSNITDIKTRSVQVVGTFRFN